MRRHCLSVFLLLFGSFCGGASAQIIGGGVIQSFAATAWVSLAGAVSGTYTTNSGMLGVANATNSYFINAANVDVSGAPAGSQSQVGNNTEIDVNGSSATGNVTAVNGVTWVKAIKAGQTGATLNFVGVAGTGQSAINMGGTGGTPLGAIFGMGPAAVAGAGATFLLNVTGGEADTGMVAGSSTSKKSGWSIAQLPVDAVQGTNYDAGLSVSIQNGGIGWKNGILFSDYNGGFPISSGGAFIASQGSQTLGRGIDFSSATFTGAPITMPLMTPASSSAACIAGAVEWDTGFVYICTATNTWKRATLAAF